MHLEEEPAGEGSWGSPKSQGKEKRKMVLRGGSEVSGGGGSRAGAGIWSVHVEEEIQN